MSAGANTARSGSVEITGAELHAHVPRPRKSRSHSLGRLLISLLAMPKGRRKTGTLARLEARLHRLNQERRAVIAEITSVVEQLSLGAMDTVAKIGQFTALGAELPSEDPATAKKPRRRLSAAGRAKLRASARARWAAAKKAGKTRLG